MRLKVSSKRERVSLSILRIASSSVVSAEVTSANCRSRYSLRSLDSLSSSMAARFTWPSFSRSARAPCSDSSQAGTAASAARPARISARSKRVAANCSTMPSRRTRDSCATMRACSIASRAALTRVSASRRFSSSARNALSASSSARRSVASSDSISRRRARKSLSLPSSSTIGRSPSASAASSSAAAHLRLRALVGHALQAHASSRSRWSGAIRCGSAGRGRRAAPPAKRARAACTASRRSSRSPSSAARRESSASSATRPRSSSARARASVSWPRPSFARDFRGLFFEALAAQRGFLRTRTLAFELTEQVGMFAMRALDAALRLRRARVPPSRDLRGRWRATLPCRGCFLRCARARRAGA